MSRVWRQIPDKKPELIAAVSKSAATAMNIPVPEPGKSPPILRLNGLPVSVMPDQCLELQFDIDQEWADLHAAEDRSKGSIICTKESGIWAWGHEANIRNAFGPELLDIQPVAFGARVNALKSHFYLKGFIERGIATALKRGLPLVHRTWRFGSTLILDRRTPPNTWLLIKSAIALAARFLSGKSTH